MPKSREVKTQELARLLQQACDAYARGGLVQAEHHCLRALKADRNSCAALNLLGVIVGRAGRHGEACRLFGKALKVEPDNAQAHVNLGNALIAERRFDDAIASFRRAAALEPGGADAHFGLALALKSVDRRREADTSYLRALAARRASLSSGQGDFPGWYRLAREFERLGDLASARDCCRAALDMRPDSAAARGAMLMYQLPAVFDDGESVADARRAFERELAALGDWLDARRPPDGYAALDNVRVFYLAYQEESNLDLLSRFGDLSARVLANWRESQALARRAGAGSDRIRIGIVMANVTNNSVWRALVRGWVEHLDPARFELHLFRIEPHEDEETRFARTRAIETDLAGRNLPDSVRSILACDPDVLIYPELAMHPKPVVLASLRLAPVQVASWGHPESSGLPTIDYYVSAEGLEPPGAQSHYREGLVMLPNLGCCYQPSALRPVAPDLARLGIAPDRPLLLCAGTPFKYAPRFDRVLTEIARRLDRCLLVFFDFDRAFLSEKLRRRLDAAFAAAGLVLGEHVVFIPWQPQAEYYGLLSRAVAQLDTIGFSGFNTALQSIECGLPVVTREGRYMRGRLASGILKRMGLPELVAATEDEYIELTVRLATDPAYRRQIRERIESSRHVLYGDLAPVRALESFITDTVERHRQGALSGGGAGS